MGRGKRRKTTTLGPSAHSFSGPLPMRAVNASPQKLTLAESTLARTLTMRRPRRVVGDHSYVGDPINQQFTGKDIVLIPPDWTDQSRPGIRHMHILGRYRRCRKIERLCLSRSTNRNV